MYLTFSIFNRFAIHLRGNLFWFLHNQHIHDNEYLTIKQLIVIVKSFTPTDSIV